MEENRRLYQLKNKNPLKWQIKRLLKASRGKSQVKKKELEKIRRFLVPKMLKVVKKLAVWENKEWKEYV